MPKEQEVMTVEEVAKRLRISRNACYAAVAAGEIPAVKVGRLIKIPRARFDRWLAGEAA